MVNSIQLETYSTDVGSETYREILEAINEENERNAVADEPAVSLRLAVMKGLGLRDAYIGKLKAGDYVPSMERFAALAEYLNTTPDRFTGYVRKYILSQVEDPVVLELFRTILSYQEPKNQNLLKAALLAYAKRVRQTSDR